MWNFRASKILWCARHVQNFVVFWYSSSSWQTKNYKFVRQWTVISKYIAKKFIVVWIFFVIKEAWCPTCVQIFMMFGYCTNSWQKETKFGSDLKKKLRYFFLARAPRMSFDHKILHASCVPEHLWCQNVSCFFEFFNLLFTDVHI